jgi:hypothetical protein
MSVTSAREGCSAMLRSAPNSPQEPFRAIPDSARLKRARERLRAVCARHRLLYAIPADTSIRGNAAYIGSALYARYEGGSWRFAPRGGTLRNPAAFEATLHEASTTKRGGLLSQAGKSESAPAKPTTITVGNTP